MFGAGAIGGRRQCLSTLSHTAITQKSTCQWRNDDGDDAVGGGGGNDDDDDDDDDDFDDDFDDDDDDNDYDIHFLSSVILDILKNH